MQLYSPFCGLIICAFGSGVFSAETTHKDWNSVVVGSGTKPAFDFAPDGSVHVMGMTEEIEGVVWHAGAASAGGPWTPKNISTGYFYGPGDIIVDPSGGVHIAFHDHDTENPRHFVLSQDGAVVSDNTIESGGHDGWDNTLAMDPEGGIYMSAVNPSGFGAPDGLEFGSYDGATWTFDNGIESSGQFMYGFNTALTIDSAKAPHILYCKIGNWTAPGELVYATRAAGSWNFAPVVSDGIPGRFPTLTINGEDTLLASWIDIDPGDESKATVRFGTKTKADGDWKLETVDALTSVQLGFRGARKPTSIATDSKGDPHIAFSDTGLIKYAHQSGQSADWSITTLLTDDSFSLQSLVVLRLDGDDRPMIAFWQQIDEGGVVRLLYPDGAPAGPAQPFVAAIERVLPSGDVELHWQSMVGYTYKVQSSDDLVTWRDVAGSTVTGDGTAKTFSQTAPQSSARYYRIVQQSQ
jgi:hypothetical protein